MRGVHSMSCSTWGKACTQICFNYRAQEKTQIFTQNAKFSLGKRRPTKQLQEEKLSTPFLRRDFCFSLKDQMKTKLLYRYVLKLYFPHFQMFEDLTKILYYTPHGKKWFVSSYSLPFGMVLMWDHSKCLKIKPFYPSHPDSFHFKRTLFSNH